MFVGWSCLPCYPVGNNAVCDLLVMSLRLLFWVSCFLLYSGCFLCSLPSDVIPRDSFVYFSKVLAKDIPLPFRLSICLFVYAQYFHFSLAPALSYGFNAVDSTLIMAGFSHHKRRGVYWHISLPQGCFPSISHMRARISLYGWVSSISWPINQYIYALNISERNTLRTGVKWVWKACTVDHELSHSYHTSFCV